MFVEQIWQWLWSGSSYQVFSGFLVFVVVFLLAKMIQLRYDITLPPGPRGVPIWGYLPFMKSPTHLQFNQLAKKYGKMFSVRLGSELVVVLSDYRLIRDAFRRDDFTGRPHTDFMNIIDGYGIVNTEGALWKDQRRFLHGKLRNGMTQIGDGRRNMSTRIMGEVHGFLQTLTRSGGTPTNISPLLAVSISNVICSLSMNLRFRHDDPKFQRFMFLIDEGFKLFASLNSANYIWLLRFLPGIHSIRNKISANRTIMTEFLQVIIDEHRETYNENVTRDILDVYLHELRQAESENRLMQLFQGKDKERQIQQILGDLFSAGMETVKNTLEWAVVFMLHYPEAAKAVQDELDQVVGRSRLPTMEDLPFLPITEATIQEILRRSNVVPLGTTHATTRTVTFNGYTLPSETHVIPLLYAVHMDPELWDEPEVFRPSRFLSDEGKVIKPEFFMPFGVGRRMCLGDTLARTELFLFFSSMMHKFNLSLPEGDPLPSLQGNVGVTISPEPFKVCLLQRDLDLVDCASNDGTTNGPLRNIGSH